MHDHTHKTVSLFILQWRLLWGT